MVDSTEDIVQIVSFYYKNGHCSGTAAGISTRSIWKKKYFCHGSVRGLWWKFLASGLVHNKKKGELLRSMNNEATKIAGWDIYR